MLKENFLPAVAHVIGEDLFEAHRGAVRRADAVLAFGNDGYHTDRTKAAVGNARRVLTADGFGLGSVATDPGGRLDGPHLSPPGPHFSNPGAFDPRDARLPWGKHKGQRLGDLPFEYVAWLADSAESPVWRGVAQRVLGLLDEPDDDTEPDPTSAAVALPGVVFRWNQAMVAKYGDDALCLEVVAVGPDELKKLTTAFTRRPWIGEEAA